MLKEILVIDDNSDIRFLICNILKEQNFEVRSAANYDQAVLEINKRLPDLAIIDIDKPYTVDQSNILYKCGWSPFSNTTFKTYSHLYIIEYDFENVRSTESCAWISV